MLHAGETVCTRSASCCGKPPGARRALTATARPCPPGRITACSGHTCDATAPYVKGLAQIGANLGKRADDLGEWASVRSTMASMNRIDASKQPDPPNRAEGAACDGCHREVRHALGFRERNPEELELRVALGGRDRHVCEVVLDEREDEVHVRVVVCRRDHDAPGDPDPEYVDWPVRTWLQRPLGERAVIDADTDEELPLFTPRFRDNVLQPDHGYRPVNRRRPAGPRRAASRS